MDELHVLNHHSLGAYINQVKATYSTPVCKILCSVYLRICVGKITKIKRSTNFDSVVISHDDFFHPFYPMIFYLRIITMIIAMINGLFVPGTFTGFTVSPPFFPGKIHRFPFPLKRFSPENPSKLTCAELNNEPSPICKKNWVVNITSNW